VFPEVIGDITAEETNKDTGEDLIPLLFLWSFHEEGRILQLASVFQSITIKAAEAIFFITYSRQHERRGTSIPIASFNFPTCK